MRTIIKGQHHQWNGIYYSMEDEAEINELKKCMFYQKPSSNELGESWPGRWYFIFVRELGGMFIQEAFTVPQDSGKAKWIEGLEKIEVARTKEEAWKLFKDQFDWKNKIMNKEDNEKVKFDMLMPRLLIPPKYQDMMQAEY